MLLASALCFIDVIANRTNLSASVSDVLPVIPKSHNSHINLSRSMSTLELFSGFDKLELENIVTSEPERNKEGLTEEEQLAQEGLLRILYIGNKAYRLSAIIKHGDYIANLSVTDNSTPDSPPRGLLLKRGDRLHEYQVVSLTERRITLRHQKRELWLQLFNSGQIEIVSQ